MKTENEQNLLDSENQINSEVYETIKKIFRFDFATGLPCGELRNFISEVNSDPEIAHSQATNEREVVGLAAGAWLAGKKPVLYMQNSGFFESSNDIGSILIASKIPALFVISWRGIPGESATQHFATGRATIPLIESLGLPYLVWPEIKDLTELREKMHSLSLPGVILVKKEKINKNLDFHYISSDIPLAGELFKEPLTEKELEREQVLDILFSRLIKPDDATFSSTGLISRSVYQNHDSPNQFYNTGGFGLTSLIGLGFKLNHNGVRTVVIDGDGSVLTNLGSLNIIGHSKAEDFIHIVLDNGIYFSCSREPTIGSEKIPEIARIFGYKNVYSVSSKRGLKEAIEKIAGSKGLQMLHINIQCAGSRDLERPLAMAEFARRFKNYFDEK